jgi:hypothetical protein
MEMNHAEVKVLEQAAEAIEQLSEMQLALIGGGIGNVLLG